jgi:hypothetical protein
MEISVPAGARFSFFQMMIAGFPRFGPDLRLMR